MGNMRLSRFSNMKGVPGVRNAGSDGSDYKAGRTPEPDFAGRSTRQRQILEPEVVAILNRIGHDPDNINLARRILVLYQEYPHASLPEAIAVDWLRRSGLHFLFQEAIWGGRQRVGGSVIDILVEQGGSWTAWSIIGVYWHQASFQDDTADMVSALSATVDGMRVMNYVRLFEDDVYFERPRVFEWGLAGLELH